MPSHDFDAMFTEAESDPRLSKEAFKLLEERLRVALVKAQYQRLGKKTLLIVVAGIDGAGKGDTINLLNTWMDPRHIKTLAYDPIDPHAPARPPLWRYWKDLPATGETAVIFGSWYTPLIRETSRKQPNPDRIEALSTSIRRFEALLAAEGVQIVKLWFHLSAKAQQARLTRLLDNPETAWQVNPDDLKVHKKFKRLRQGGQVVINNTHRTHAPWVVIPSADTQLRAIRSAEAVLAALRQTRPPKIEQATHTRPARIVNRLARLDYHAQVEGDDYESALGRLQGRLLRAVRAKNFQHRSLLLVFEGTDAAGKGSTIRRITQALDARQFDIMPIAAPTSEERAHPYLWRFWRHVPGPARIAIFDRSWYGRVLVERVEKLTSPAHWRRGYTEINDFEAQLIGSGTIVLKFWLAITADVQLERFKAREKTPFKHFKITAEDWRNRDKWDAYVTAANDMFAQTDTPQAPWHLIPANDKRYARLQVLQRIVKALERAR